MENELRRLPSVEKILSTPLMRELEGKYPHGLLVEITREILEDERARITTGRPAPPLEVIISNISGRLHGLEDPGLRRVINASGVILHTNLGRAPLSLETIEAMDRASQGYSNLEFDLEAGARSSRQVYIEPLLKQLTGAEAALVVNNNAAAVLLGLTALARRKEVIVSRGQAVEIGGGFRIPDVMRQSGAKLIEVGTTNCTYIGDYEKAITPRTAALLQVHSSNFKVVGFTASVQTGELVALGDRYDLPVFDDEGSGCLLDTTQFGLDREPVVQESVAAGTSLVFFSGDKLLGGPQAGIIVGKKELINKLKVHPLARAMRIDKIRLAGLIVTLGHYLKGEAASKLPVWRMVSAPVENIEGRANQWAQALGGQAQVINGETMVGGGSLPGGTLPTRLVSLGKGQKNARQVQAFSQKLLKREIPIVGRISGNEFLLDPRTVLPEEDPLVIKALSELLSN